MKDEISEIINSKISSLKETRRFFHNIPELGFKEFKTSKEILRRLEDLGLEGWSKTFCMTGWRLGWSMWPKKLYEHANKLCVNDHSCPSVISQYAGLEALKGPKDEIEKIKKEFQNRKNFVHKKLNELENMNCFEPGGAFYAFPNISLSGYNGQKFSDIALEEKGVALVPGTSFGDSAKNFVRVSYANSMENLEKAIYRLSTI